MSDEKTLSLIQKCADEKQLRNWIANAKRLQQPGLEKMAIRRLIEVMSKAQAGTLEWDFWRTIYAFEYMLSEERGRTTRLSRTRQKIARDGIEKMLIEWALDKEAKRGFEMLIERNMPELLAEAVILRHPSRFSHDVLEAARTRLLNAGVDPSVLDHPASLAKPS